MQSRGISGTCQFLRTPPRRHAEFSQDRTLRVPRCSLTFFTLLTRQSPWDRAGADVLVVVRQLHLPRILAECPLRPTSSNVPRSPCAFVNRFWSTTAPPFDRRDGAPEHHQETAPPAGLEAADKLCNRPRTWELFSKSAKCFTCHGNNQLQLAGAPDKSRRATS